MFAYEGADEPDFVGVYQVLESAQAAREKLDLEVKLFAPAHGLRGALDMEINPDEAGYDLAGFDLLVVPGGPGLEAAARDERLITLLREFAAKRRVAAVSTGVLLLQAAGLLNGRRVSWVGGDRALLDGGVKPLDERVVEDGSIITASGATASADLGKWILRRFFGEGLAQEVSKRVDPPPPP